MGDFFHEAVSFEWRHAIYKTIELCPQHIFVFLTKRPQNISSFWIPPKPNVWLGVSCENQARADERIPILLQIPAAVRFVSLEPMLGPIDLQQAHGLYYDKAGCDFRKIDWAIVGGETGPGARSLHPDWVRKIRDDCQAADVSLFFKGWGEFCAISQMPLNTYKKWCDMQQGWTINGPDDPVYIGKKVAGRLIDGRTWEEYPKEDNHG